eukprot:jgi/Tetstr1/447282/TSEL_034719.t1
MADPYASKIKPVRSVQFRLLSTDEIRKKSVMECNSTDSYLGSTPVSHGTMSLVMGADQNHNCATCGQSMKFCPGHPGRIELAKPCFNALMFDTVIKVLRCVCWKCSRLLYHPSHPDMASIMRLHGQKRFEALMKVISKSSTNKARCGNANPHGCGAMQPVRINKQFLNDRFMRVSMELAFEDVEGGSATADDDQASEKLSMSAEDVLTILKRIADDDIAAMGFHPKLSRPESMVIECLLVPPPAIRPSHQSALLQRSESDLTIVISNIIKANNQLKNRIKAGKPIEPNDLYLGLLQYHVATLMDNEMTGLAPSTQRTGRSIVSISQRLKTKEGRVRGNLLGKRVDSSARCVITPDPYISLDEFGVPLKVAMNITFPEMVNERNLKRLQEMVDNGPTNYPGARFVELKRGRRTVSLSPDRKPVVLEPGDVVQRHIMDGDYLLFNRQPTLHKMSMMAHRAKVMDHNTFRLNPCCTTPYNADFDGDELNMHAGISAMTMTEIASLAAVPVQVISPRTSGPIIGIVQDVALGVYELTNPATVIDKYLYANLMAPLPMLGGKRLEKKEEYTGQEALSAVVPPLVNMTKKNESFNSDDPTDPNNEHNLVEIAHGRVTGVFDKNTFGSSTSGLIHHVYNEIGPKPTVEMVDATQRMVCDWFKHRGFSVGLSDLVISEAAKQSVKDVINETKQHVYDTIAEVHSGRFNNTGLSTPSEAFEKQMRELLNKARSDAQKIGKKQISSDNRMMSMIKSKSKGNDINVVQMIATLGQQIADGKRPAYGFDSRTLPHYYKYDDGPEARGFVENSFMSGLSPSEFFFHSTGGREGLMDTAVKSVAYDTPIIIMHDGVPKRVQIGEWIDHQMGKFPFLVNRYKNETNLELMDLEDDVQIATMDYDGNVSWQDVTAITRHDPGETLYKITTRHGRSVTVTAGKSLLIWLDELKSFREIETPLIRVGDSVPLTANLAKPPEMRKKNIQYSAEDGSMVGMAIAEHGGEISPETFFASERFVKGLLESYLNSKKCAVTEEGIVVNDTAIVLEGLSVLLNRIGVVTEISADAMTVTGAYASRVAAVLKLDRPGHLASHHSTAPAAESYFAETKNDVVMDEIVSIEEIVPRRFQKMYDLTIPKTLNFALANGLQVRDTSESGYIQRKLIKAMEDCKIATDHTVRNAAGHIVQFQYGEDGMDSTTIENQKLFHVGYDNDKTVSEFLITTADPLDTYLNAATFKKFSAEVNWDDFDQHVRDIIRDKRELIMTTFSGKLQKNINYPVAFDRIIKNAIQRQYLDIRKGTPSDLNPVYALKRLNETIPKLVITSAIGPCIFIKVLMRSYLSPKQMMKLGATKATLDAIYDTVVDRFFESIAHPGEMVGIVAAQSIGEPTTQLTLNSLTRDSEVLIKRGGVVESVRMGDLVDPLLPGVTNPLVQTDVAQVERMDVECMGISSTERTRWAKITHVSRHPSHNRVIKVTTESGRTVEATEGHGFLIRQNNRIATAYGHELKVGDRIPVVSGHLMYRATGRPDGRTPSDTIPGVNGILRECIAKASEGGDRPSFIRKLETFRKRNLMSRTYAKMLYYKARDEWGDSPQLTRELQQIVGADCSWDPIASIEGVDAVGQMVYDFSVEEDLQSFMLSNGIFVHNTFHLSGIESASRATRGLPRVKELLSVSKNPKQVIITASLVPGFRESIDDANKVKNELETTYLSQLVAKSSVYFDPDKFSTNIAEDRDIVEAYRLFDKVDAQRNAADVSPWVIRLEMSKPDLLEHGVTMFDIAEAVNDFYKETVCCMFSDDNADQLIFRVRLTTIATAGTSTDMLTDVRAFELSMLESVVIKGGFGIARAIPLKKHEPKEKCFDESIGEFVGCDSAEEEWVLETDGRDLGEIMAHPLVVSNTTISNDINEIWSTLGIEAARSALLRELGEVMKEAYTNLRHFYMLADVMCAKGVLTSIDRHGLNRGDTAGPLTKASFEETIDIIRNAGMFAEVDNVNSVAASIMLGQVVRAGTGGASVYLDETLLGELPEFIEEETVEDAREDVSDDDLCRTIMKFMYVEPAQSTNSAPKLIAPRITYV